jgi:hypothetical protein
MESRSSQPTNVIRFPGARSAANPRRDQRSFMDSVYSAGSLTIGADDRMTTIFGFVVIDEIQADGMRRRLRPSEAFHASTALPWRVSKPSGSYRVDDRIPETDEDLFAALQA